MKHKKRLLLICLAVVICLSAFLLLWRPVYTYDKEELQDIFDEYSLYSHMENNNLKTNLKSSDFNKFTAGEVTRQEIHETFGQPHAYFGSGFVREVYFTADHHLVYLYEIDGKVVSIYKLNLLNGKYKELTAVEGWHIETQ